MKTSLSKRIIKDAGALTGRFKFIKSWKGKVISETPWIENMIMKDTNYGVNIVLQNMIGETTYSCEITHAKIGTGTTAVSETQHDLVTPTAIGGGANPTIVRGDESINSINVAHYEFFISDADLPNGTYKEWGLFTGTYGGNEKMFSRALITPNYTKATNQDTTVVHEITLNN